MSSDTDIRVTRLERHLEIVVDALDTTASYLEAVVSVVAPTDEAGRNEFLDRVDAALDEIRAAKKAEAQAMQAAARQHVEPLGPRLVR